MMTTIKHGRGAPKLLHVLQRLDQRGVCDGDRHHRSREQRPPLQRHCEHLHPDLGLRRVLACIVFMLLGGARTFCCFTVSWPPSWSGQGGQTGPACCWVGAALENKCTLCGSLRLCLRDDKPALHQDVPSMWPFMCVAFHVSKEHGAHAKVFQGAGRMVWAACSGVGLDV